MKKSIINSFNYAVTGIMTSIKSERNMLIHYIVAILVVITSLFFDFTRAEFLILLFSISLVLSLELINTAIESVVDMITDDFHPLAKIAKDIAAGAVLIATGNALIVGYLLFFDRINDLTEMVAFKIKASPIHLTFLALILVTLLTIGLKTKFYRDQGTHFQGGTVSGHAAIAFCMATIIAFLVEHALIVTLSYGLAGLVAESRVEGRIHTTLEVILGGLLGLIVGILVFQIVG